MKRRGRNPNEDPRVRPITKIELDERNNKKRFIWAIALLMVGLTFVGVSLFSFLSKDPGWMQIDPAADTADSVAGDMVLLYELGAGERSATAEHKALATRYTELCIDAYRIFSVQYAFDGVQNLYQVNLQLGQSVEVHPALYRALAKIEMAGNRFLFAAPFYREYQNLFLSVDDGYAEQYDPRKSEEIAAYFAELSAFTSSEEHIRLELEEGNKVRLVVSNAYRAFAAANGIETFVDFFWTRNAFAVDYIADNLIAEGYTHGSLSSYDGYVRVLEDRDVAYSYHFYASDGQQMYDAARLDYTGMRSMIYLRADRLYERDDVYYTYQSGERRTPYVDVTDGLCKNAAEGLIAYADQRGCADVLLAVMPVYISDEWNPARLAELATQKLFTVYTTSDDRTAIHVNDPDAKLSEVYQDDAVSFRVVVEE